MRRTLDTNVAKWAVKEMSRAPRGAGPESSGTPCARSFFNSCESLPRRHSDAKSVVVTLPRWLTEGRASFRMMAPALSAGAFP